MFFINNLSQESYFINIHLNFYDCESSLYDYDISYYITSLKPYTDKHQKKSVHIFTNLMENNRDIHVTTLLKK